jgi:FMN phosphatase YigB (HAD superfamily)
MIGNDVAAYIFDLDGTLYSTSGMDDANRKAIIEAVAEYLAISYENAEQKINVTLGEYGTSAGRPSLYGTALGIGVPDQVIAHFQNRYVQPAILLKPDPELADLLFNLAIHAKLALLTNTRTATAKQALSVLGIQTNTFNEVWGGDYLTHPKPNADEILRLCSRLGVSPSETISVGDRWNVDLAPAVEAGLMVQKVSGRDELVSWLKQL